VGELRGHHTKISYKINCGGIKMKSKIITMFLVLLFLFSIPLLVQADTPKTKVIYNGVDMTDALQPFIKNNVMYTIDGSTVKMISPIHKIKTFPIFQKVKGKWVQTSNIFTNTDWEETISINLISTEPNSNIYSILRGGKIVKEKLNNAVLPYPGKKQKGLVYYGTKPLNISDYNYPNYLFFKNKMKEGTYSFNALPVRSFIKSVLPGAEITYDNATRTVTINCKGSY